MPGDARDPGSYQQQNPNNPTVRNPYGNETWNQGGTVFTMPNMGSNSYGWGSNNYGSGQAQNAYAAAQRTLTNVDQQRHTTNADGTNALTGRPPMADDRYNNDFSSRTRPDEFTDYARGDRADAGAQGNYPNPYAGAPGAQNQAGGGVQMDGGATTSQGMPGGNYSAPEGGGASGASGAPGSGYTGFGGNVQSSGGAFGAYGNPYGVPGPRSFEHPNVSEDPRMGSLLESMNSSASLDRQRAQAMFDLYQKKQREGAGQEQYLSQLYGDVLGRSGKSFDPNNPQTFALMAPQMQQVAANKDAMIKALEASGLTGGELEAAKARAITGAYGQGAQLRQGQVQNALGYFQNLANIDQHGFDPGQASGAAQQMLGYYGQKYGTDVNAANQLYGTDVGAEMSRYGTDVGAQGQKYGVDTGAASSRYSTDKNYDLALKQMAAQAQAAKQGQKNSLWGGLLNTLGGLASNKLNGGGGGGGSNAFGGGGGSAPTNSYFDQHGGGNFSIGQDGNPNYSTGDGGYYGSGGYYGNDVSQGGYNAYQNGQNGGGQVPSFLDPNSGYTGNEQWSPGTWGG